MSISVVQLAIQTDPYTICFHFLQSVVVKGLIKFETGSLFYIVLLEVEYHTCSHPPFDTSCHFLSRWLDKLTQREHFLDTIPPVKLSQFLFHL